MKIEQFDIHAEARAALTKVRTSHHSAHATAHEQNFVVLHTVEQHAHFHDGLWRARQGVVSSSTTECIPRGEGVNKVCWHPLSWIATTHVEYVARLQDLQGMLNGL